MRGNRIYKNGKFIKETKKVLLKELLDENTTPNRKLVIIGKLLTKVSLIVYSTKNSTTFSIVEYGGLYSTKHVFGGLYGFERYIECPLPLHHINIKYGTFGISAFSIPKKNLKAYLRELNGTSVRRKMISYKKKI